MLRPKSVRLQMLAMIILLTASTCTSQETSQLKLDSILPPLTGETVSGRSLNLPEAAAGQTSVARKPTPLLHTRRQSDLV
jgi:hypothetical protein